MREYFVLITALMSKLRSPTAVTNTSSMLIIMFRSTFSISNKLFNGDDGPFTKRMRFSEDSEKTQWRRVSRSGL